MPHMDVFATGPATLVLIVLCLFYHLCLAVYRLYFHPLSRFPGPKFAAATYFAELYYELLHGEGGQFAFAYRQWHDRYGPIIRITPDELHVRDSEWYEYFFSPSRPVRKPEHFGYAIEQEHAAFGTADPEVSLVSMILWLSSLHARF